MIEDEVRLEVVGVDKNAFLAGFKAKAIAHFQQELLHMVDDGFLQVRFGPSLFALKAQEFKRNRLMENIYGC